MFDLLANSLSVTLSLNETELICLHTVKYFQVFLSNTDSFTCTQLNGFKDCYLILIIQFHVNHLFVHNLIVSSIVNDWTILYDL